MGITKPEAIPKTLGACVHCDIYHGHGIDVESGTCTDFLGWI